MSLLCYDFTKPIDFQLVSRCSLEWQEKAKMYPSDYQPLTAACGFLVYFILCHMLLISKLHFCLYVRSVMGANPVILSTCKIICFIKRIFSFTPTALYCTFGVCACIRVNQPFSHSALCLHAVTGAQNTLNISCLKHKHVSIHRHITPGCTALNQSH